MRAEAYAAVDLGAESGRVALARFDGARMGLEEVHRFPNAPVALPEGLRWDALRLYADACAGLRAARRHAGELASVGVDAWGVDYGLLDRTGALLGSPFHHRDARTEGMMERAAERVPPEEIYAATGIQFMPINTLPQLLADEGTPALEAAATLLMVPDLLRFWLSGERAAEATIASTTQLYDPVAGDWARDLIARLGLPERIFPPVRAPGGAPAGLRPEVAASEGLSPATAVALVASHDTASAVVAVPSGGTGFAYVSSGTWSLVGLELPAPVLTEAAREANLTNETGYGGRVRFLRNVMGLWLVQECRRAWARAGRELGYGELERLAAEADSEGPLVDPDDPAFLRPGDMPARIRAAAAARGQARPETPGEIVRCVLDSLACKYRLVLERAEAVAGRASAPVVHVVGGGARNALLCRLTAEVTGRPVLAGPVEAAALGNALVQAGARGRLGSLEEMREVVRRSAPPVHHEPGRGSRGADRYGRFLEVTARRGEPIGAA